MKGTITFSHEVDKKSMCCPVLEYSGHSVTIDIGDTLESQIKFYKSINTYEKVFIKLEELFQNTVVETELDKLLDAYKAYSNEGDLVIKCKCKSPVVCLGHVLYTMLTEHENK